MIYSMILRTAIRYLLPLLLLFAVFVLLRGHDAPGGGFVGALLAASAFMLYAIGFGVDEARQLILVRPITLVGGGLLLAVMSASLALFFNLPFMTGLWVEIGPLKIGTPTIFDFGVFFTVLGVVLMILFSLAEADND